jgi:putative flippase GtrA
MRTKSCEPNAVRDVRLRDSKPESWQLIGGTEVMPEGAERNSGKRDDCAAASLANSKPGNDMRATGGRRTKSDRRKDSVVNDLRGFEGPRSVDELGKNCKSLIAPSALVRWCKFNVVGGIGILVQFAALFFLKSVMHFNYLFATAIAVEAAVVHNFVWHEQFTWSDRTTPDRAESWRRSLPRLLRFNLSNGAVSIVGNLALMKVMVGQGHMNYLLANAIAIALCSVVNFLVSETWVFEENSSATSDHNRSKLSDPAPIVNQTQTIEF